MTDNETWIITCATRGFGRAIAERVLATDGTVVAAVIDAARAATGRIDALVNNAGRGIVGAVEELAEEELRVAMDLHLPVALIRGV